MSNIIPAEPDRNNDILPPEYDINSILDLVALALSKLPGADGFTIMKAHAVMDSQYAKGSKRGQELGFQNGYQRGYAEGLQDGQREALDTQAQEEAERAVLKAAARAGKPS